MLTCFCSGLLRDGMHVLYVEVLVLPQRIPKILLQVLRQRPKKSGPRHRTWRSLLASNLGPLISPSGPTHKTQTLYLLIGQNKFA